MMKKTFFIHTTGCKANQWDSSVIAGNLERAGFDRAPIHGAHIVIINACTVTEGAVRDIRRFVNRLKRENAGAKIVLAGCHGQVYPDDNFGADLVLGQAEKFSSERFIDRKGVFVSTGKTFAIEQGPRTLFMEGKTRFFLKIQDGCDRFCSYCIVPYARGNPRSRPIEEIVGIMGELRRQGVQETVLTGIEISAWRDPESGQGLGSLLEALEDAPTPARIRLSSIDPMMFDDAFIETVARSRKISKSFHISLQSASDGILSAMGRPYRHSDMERLLDKLLGRIGDAGIGMDVIAGFPGEKAPHFQETLSFLGSCGVYYLHVFPFSARPGTKAAGMDGKVPAGVKKQRVKLLKELDAQKREAFHRRFLGSVMSIVPEGKRYRERYMRGYTDNYIPVHIPYDKKLENDLVRVRIDRIEDGLVIGEPVQKGNDHFPMTDNQ